MRQRTRSSSQCSSLLRRERRGGVGSKNISELNRSRSRVVRRMRWKITGPATANAPSITLPLQFILTGIAALLLGMAGLALLAHLLQVPAAPNDGNPETLKQTLR